MIGLPNDFPHLSKQLGEGWDPGQKDSKGLPVDEENYDSAGTYNLLVLSHHLLIARPCLASNVFIDSWPLCMQRHKNL
jgi:hypothetical protein